MLWGLKYWEYKKWYGFIAKICGAAFYISIYVFIVSITWSVFLDEYYSLSPLLEFLSFPVVLAVPVGVFVLCLKLERWLEGREGKINIYGFVHSYVRTRMSGEEPPLSEDEKKQLHLRMDIWKKQKWIYYMPWYIVKWIGYSLILSCVLGVIYVCFCDLESLFSQYGFTDVFNEFTGAFYEPTGEFIETNYDTCCMGIKMTIVLILFIFFIFIVGIVNKINLWISEKKGKFVLGFLQRKL